VCKVFFFAKQVCKVNSVLVEGHDMLSTLVERSYVLSTTQNFLSCSTMFETS
jgi:hypothetical protein